MSLYKKQTEVSNYIDTFGLFNRLSQAGITVNLSKSEFGKATVVFLGHVVGQGQVKPVQAKVEAICNFHVPKSRREFMRFLAMTGYYCRFCENFAQIAAPLTSLLQKNRPLAWEDSQQEAFEKVKAILVNQPVLTNFDEALSFM